MTEILLAIVFGPVLWLCGAIVFDAVHFVLHRMLRSRFALVRLPHKPGWGTPPAYHALHHAWPDAYYSAYTKGVDWIVGGGARIGSRRFAWIGPDSPLAKALRSAVSQAGGLDVGEAVDADVRVCLRTLAVPDEPIDEAMALRAARRALFWVRRDAHFVPLADGGLTDWLRFRRVSPLAPAHARMVRHRLELAAGGA